MFDIHELERMMYWSKRISSLLTVMSDAIGVCPAGDGKYTYAMYLADDQMQEFTKKLEEMVDLVFAEAQDNEEVKSA